jgi:DNA repair/transcription protein MET18/MMS19
MPVLLEKLSGSGGEMKIDTLRTIEACLPVFGRDNAQSHQAELWEGLKVEVRAAPSGFRRPWPLRLTRVSQSLQVLYTSSDEAEAAALRTMRVFLRVLVGDDATVESDFFNGVILEEMEVTLREPEKSLAVQIVKMIGASFAASGAFCSPELTIAAIKRPWCWTLAPLSAAGSTEDLGRKTYGKILPQLLGQFHAASTSITQKQAILTSLSALIHAAYALYAAPGETRTAESDGVLLELKDQLLGCLTAGLDVEEGRQAAMEGLMGLLPWLEADERSYVVSKIGSLLSTDSVGDDIRFVPPA